MARAENSSAVGRIFRRIADFFDALGEKFSPASEARARTETEIIALSIAFAGILVIGIAKLGWSHFFWILGFAVTFTVGIHYIFLFPALKRERRNVILSLLLVFSVITAADRIVALLCFIILSFLLLLYYLLDEKSWYQSVLSQAAILLFCFFSYSIFSSLLAWQRNSDLRLKGGLRTDCKILTQHICSVLETKFLVPEFWLTRGSNESSLINDLSVVADFTRYSDSATENTIAHAAFSVSPDVVIANLAQYFSLQKSFLQSRTIDGTPLTVQQIMKGADAELYAVPYESEIRPGYLAERVQSTAMLLLHQQRGVTWLFIIDGHDLSSREFLLHRIISGFK